METNMKKLFLLQCAGPDHPLTQYIIELLNLRISQTKNGDMNSPSIYRLIGIQGATLNTTTPILIALDARTQSQRILASGGYLTVESIEVPSHSVIPAIRVEYCPMTVAVDSKLERIGESDECVSFFNAFLRNAVELNPVGHSEHRSFWFHNFQTEPEPEVRYMVFIPASESGNTNQPLNTVGVSLSAIPSLLDDFVPPTLPESEVATYFGRSFVAGSSVNARAYFTTQLTEPSIPYWEVYNNEYYRPIWYLGSYLLLINGRVIPSSPHTDRIEIVDTIKVVTNLSGNLPVIRGPVFRSNGIWICEDEYGQQWSLPSVPQSIQRNEFAHYFLSGRTSDTTFTIVSFQRFQSFMGGHVKCVEIVRP